jgi:hypothetical protein
VLQPDGPVVARVRLLEQVERAVVEDVAVLVDLHERRAPVRRGRPQHALQVLAVGVHGPGDERGLGADRQRDRVERVVQRPIGVDLVILPTSEVGEYCPLVSP